jgi:ribonuclease PH
MQTQTPITAIQRVDGRASDQLRPFTIKKDVAQAAAGSALIAMGNTEVICAASVEESIPRWMRQQGVSGGWVTAEYSMLPYSTGERTRREATTGRLGGRTVEIQRLIGRSLRAVIDLKALGTRTIWVDCDVLRADGGTRTAAVTGGFIALRLAVNKLLSEGTLEADPIRDQVAAISVGVVENTPILDLCYTEDVSAEVDMNVVMTGKGRFVEIQGTAEGEPFSKSVMDSLQGLADQGIRTLVERQREVLV